MLLQGPRPTTLRVHITAIDAALGAASPGVAELAAIFDLAESSVSPASALTPNQHYWSQATQRRFAEPVPRRGRVVRYYDLATGDTDVDETEHLGNEYHFLPIDSTAAEQIWQTVEGRINGAVEAVLAGRPLAFGQERLLKEYVALHFARNPQIVDVHHRSVEQVVESQLAELAKTPLAGEAFYRRTGLHAPYLGGEAARFGARETQKHFMELYKTGALLRLTAQRIFEEVKDHVEPLNIELLRPESLSKEFLVGDVPALTVRESTDQVGVVGGVTVDESDYIFMALSPKTTVLLGRGSGSSSVDDATVNRLNRYQIVGAREQVFCRPNADFAAEIATWRRPTI